jgi:hypothetical protein
MGDVVGIYDKRDRDLFGWMVDLARLLGSEDDLVMVALMSGTPLPLESETEPRVWTPRSSFTRDCLAACVMGKADGRVGRPVPAHAGADYLRSYGEGMADRLATAGGRGTALAVLQAPSNPSGKV